MSSGARPSLEFAGPPPLPAELRASLDAEPLRAIAEYVCARLGLGFREGTLRLNFTDGRFRGAHIGQAGISPEDFELMGMRLAPSQQGS